MDEPRVGHAQRAVARRGEAQAEVDVSTADRERLVEAPDLVELAFLDHHAGGRDGHPVAGTVAGGAERRALVGSEARERMPGPAVDADGDPRMLHPAVWIEQHRGYRAHLRA